MIIYTPYIWLPLICAVLLAGMAMYAGRFHSIPASLPFRTLLWLCALFLLIFAVGISTTTPALRYFLAQLIYLPAAFIAPAILVMAVEYTGHTTWITRRRITILLNIPAITVLLALSYPLHTLFRYGPQIDTSGPLAIITFSRGPWYWVYYGYGSALTVGALAILISSLRNRALRRQNTLLLILGILAPTLADILTVLRITPVPSYVWTPMLFVCIGALYGWALLRGQIFAVAPIARGVVMDHIDDLVIVLDNNGRIADFNRAAQATCGISAQAIGEPPSALPAWADLLQRYGCSPTSKVARVEVEIGVGEEQHIYDLAISAIQSKASKPLGHLLILHDVTARKRTEAQLRTSEERFRQMVEVMPVPLVLTRLSDSTYQYVNRLASDQVGLSQLAMIGKRATDFYVEPRARQVVIDAIHQAGAIYNFETLLKRADGSTFWALLSATLAKVNSEQVILAGIIDISERKRAQDKLCEANEHLKAQLTEIQQLQEKLREQAIRDVLTGLFNRRYMQEILDQRLAQAAREQSLVSVMMIDIDHFKQLNDDHGHKAGDRMLQAMGKLLISYTRNMDTACRYGGEEFVVIMATAALDTAMQRADELRQAFANLRVAHDGHALRATISIGVATFPTHGSDSDTLLRSADQALYMAKASGRNCVYAAAADLAAVAKLLTKD